MSNDSSKQKRSAKYSVNKWVDVCNHCCYSRCIGEDHPACPILLARERELPPEQMVIELETTQAEREERERLRLRALADKRRTQAQPVCVTPGFLHGRKVLLAFNF